MKTVRFSKIVETCGDPESYLLLSDPAKDKTFQAAVKAQRVMTVFQQTVGNTADRAEIGFQTGAAREFLVFPKSLRAFAKCNVVGIKYDLLHVSQVPKSERAASARPPKKRRAESKPVGGSKVPPKTEGPSKVIPFQPQAKAEDEEADEIQDLKKKVRRAMALLEDGKPVAAFNLLKEILDE